MTDPVSIELAHIRAVLGEVDYPSAKPLARYHDMLLRAIKDNDDRMPGSEERQRIWREANETGIH